MSDMCSRMDKADIDCSEVISLKEDSLYRLDRLQKHHKMETILEESLYVAANDNGDWVECTFFEWTSESDDGVYLTPLFSSSGPGGVDCPLRECRHTYFADKGYVFYMNRERMIAALDYCTKYWDMD